MECRVEHPLFYKRMYFLCIRCTFICLFFFIPLFYKVFKRNKAAQNVPRILSHQLRYLTHFLVLYLLSEMLGSCGTFIAPGYKYVCLVASALLSTYTLFFIGRRILGLRFLNARASVESKEKFNFLIKFKR